MSADSDPAFDMPSGFAGGLYESASGLVHFTFREYDPGSGRWTSRDPIHYGGGQYNLYEYCGSDPVNFVGPLGLMTAGDWSDVLVQAARSVGGAAVICAFTPAAPAAPFLGAAAAVLAAAAWIAGEIQWRAEADNALENSGNEIGTGPASLEPEPESPLRPTEEGFTNHPW